MRRDISRVWQRRLINCCLVVFSLLTILFPMSTVATASQKWQGVDESVVEKVAKEHGRATKTPLINTDQGDLLLFVFLLAGVVGGFTAGYYWRVLTESKVKDQE
jgi:ABC-type cobalt transport system substrate-binding protein